MTSLQALIMGIVQGLTEFLPVSSSGHLALARAVLGAGPAEDVGFEVAVHAGTLVAVLIYYRSRILSIVTEAFSGEGEGRNWVLLLVIGTIPAGFFGVFFKDSIAALFNDINLVGFALLFTAALLFSAERFSREKTTAGKMGVWRALTIGIAQAAAIIPGISRSGSTICAGLLTGVERKSVVDFAFILSLPSVGGAIILTIPDWLEGSVSFGVAHIIGGIAAFVSGYIAIALMLKIVSKGKLSWFALYCAILGVVALVV
ncbi:MAG: undecaprenyl-diphosphate phosphatase [Calditrichaeota bacterium]|nr:undecaprenyl-diphosphate phosphatase [Calditrichota bacterium]